MGSPPRSGGTGRRGGNRLSVPGRRRYAGDLVDLSKLLSPPQLEAATRLDAPVCILAGAGSGKTRVITHRIAWLMLEKRVWASRILAVTFTNKAAAEMKARVALLVPQTASSGGARSSSLLLGTFHGLAARLLRSYGNLVDVYPGFVIYDADDADRLMARIVVKDLNLEKDKAKGIASLIDAWQTVGLAPADVPKGSELLFDDALKTYEIYLRKLKEARAVDFNGLLLKLRELVTGPNADAVTQRIQHVLVDEYQDVNQVQADIVLALAKTASSVAVVGDDDQAIYGWRGASADNLKKFLQTLPGSTLVKLEENYRSTPAILEAANGIIENNGGRLGKVLRPGRTDVSGHNHRGRNVRVLKNRDEIEESRKVGMLLIEHVAAGVHLDEIAILYRTNALSRTFEDELRRLSLPYRVVGGQRFYDRREIKDVIATLRLVFNRKSDVDALRFFAAVPRGLGDKTIEKISQTAKRRGCAILDVFASDELLKESDLSGGGQAKCRAVITLLDDLLNRIGRKAFDFPADLFAAPSREGVPQADLFAGLKEAEQTKETKQVLGAAKALALVMDKMGLTDRLEAEQTEEAQGRLENLQELVNAAARFEEEQKHQGGGHDITAFLEQTALASSADEDADDDNGRGKVTLMSMHSAKGLEFEVVFIAGMEEHAFPHTRALQDDDPNALEEERRLAYVGITRAKNRLVLSWAQRRMVNGVTKVRDPSRFLFEVPKEVLEGDVPRKAGNRDSLLDLWRNRENDRRTRLFGASSVSSGDEGGRDDVVYEPDENWRPPPKPRGSRTRLGGPDDDDSKPPSAVDEVDLQNADRALAATDDLPWDVPTTSTMTNRGGAREGPPGPPKPGGSRTPGQGRWAQPTPEDARSGEGAPRRAAASRPDDASRQTALSSARPDDDDEASGAQRKTSQPAAGQEKTGPAEVLDDDDDGRGRSAMLPTTTIERDLVVAPIARRFALGGSKPPVVAVDAADEVVVDEYAAGARVFHRHFGDGSVVGTRGSGRMANVLVRFDAERSPRLIAARHLKPAAPSAEDGAEDPS